MSYLLLISLSFATDLKLPTAVCPVGVPAPGHLTGERLADDHVVWTNIDAGVVGPASLSDAGAGRRRAVLPPESRVAGGFSLNDLCFWTGPCAKVSLR